AVDAQPADAAVEHPVTKPRLRAGVLEENPRQVGLVRPRPDDTVHSALALLVPVLVVEAVIAGVDDQDVAALDGDPGLLLPGLEVLGTVDLVIADPHSREVDDAGGTDQGVDRDAG